MSRKASFSVEDSTANSQAHNDRTNAPKYLVETDPNFDGNFYKEYYTKKKYLELAAKSSKKNIGQRLQQSSIDAMFQEAVISLEAHHTKDDVLDLFKDLKKKYGGHDVIDLAIHRDEGHFEDKDGITYYPTKNIMYFEEEDVWKRIPLERYLDEDFNPEKPKPEEFSEKVDISKFKKVHNYHAHVTFTRFDLEVGKKCRMAPKDFSSRLKFVADKLKMRYEPGPGRFDKTSIKDHKEKLNRERIAKIREVLIRQGHKVELVQQKEEMQTQVNELVNAIELKIQNTNKIKQKEIDAIKKQLETAITASDKTNEEKREFHKQNRELNKRLKEQNKKKELTIESLQNQVNALDLKIKSMPDQNTINELAQISEVVEHLGGLDHLQDIQENNDKLEYENTVLKIENDELKEEKEGFKSQISTLQDKNNDLESNLSFTDKKDDIGHLKEHLETITKEKHNEDTKTPAEWIKSVASRLVKKINELHSNIKSLGAENKELESKVNNYIGLSEMLETEIKQKNDEIDELKDEVVFLKKLVDDLKGSGTSTVAVDKYNTLKNEYDSLREENARLKKTKYGTAVRVDQTTTTIGYK